MRVLVVAGEIDDAVLALLDELGKRGFHSTAVLATEALAYWHEHADDFVAVVAEFSELMIPLLDGASREVLVLVYGAAFDDPGALHFWTPVPREPVAIADALSSRLAAQ